jgi:hypothetical protein
MLIWKRNLIKKKFITHEQGEKGKTKLFPNDPQSDLLSDLGERLFAYNHSDIKDRRSLFAFGEFF